MLTKARVLTASVYKDLLEVDILTGTPIVKDSRGMQQNAEKLRIKIGTGKLGQWDDLYQL